MSSRPGATGQNDAERGQVEASVGRVVASRRSTHAPEPEDIFASIVNGGPRGVGAHGRHVGEIAEKLGVSGATRVTCFVAKNVESIFGKFCA